MAKSVEVKKNSEDDSTMDGDSEEDIGCVGRLMVMLRINPNLIMLKVTLFVMYGATASLLPYLTIHMQSIGLTVPEISFVYLALPFTTFLSPPITGKFISFIIMCPITVSSGDFNGFRVSGGPFWGV